ncbi:MAG: DUF3427 domain-containing protein, partial [Actinomycetota bacterium]|nr:DUF3427 domain-containing protein [Actinomycetota bacterium]
MALELHQLKGLSVEIEQVDAADQPHILSRHVEAAVHRALSATGDPRRRTDLVNALLNHVAAASDSVVEGPNQLLSIVRPPAPGVITTATTRPSTPLSDAALLTNAHGEPSLGAEIKA